MTPRAHLEELLTCAQKNWDLLSGELGIDPRTIHVPGLPDHDLGDEKARQ